MNMQTFIKSSTFCDYGSAVVTDASRSLELLRAIESTINSLSEISDQMSKDIGTGVDFINKINNANNLNTLDPNDKIEDNLLLAQQKVEALHQALQNGQKSAIMDTQLMTEDGVVDAYNLAVEKAADLHNTLNTLRWVIMEHDADLENSKSNKVFSKANISELVAELDSLKE
jgi:hypothetical protein